MKLWSVPIVGKSGEFAVHGQCKIRPTFTFPDTSFGKYQCIQLDDRGNVLFGSLAVLDPRVGHTMDVLSPFISILCHSD